MNRLHLTLLSNPTMTTMQFAISLVVRETSAKASPSFSFQDVPSHDVVEVNVGKDDILQNFCNKDDVAMNGTKPWRGPREKACQFMQMLVEACSTPRDVIVDCTTATGSSIQACCATRRHVLAFEEDKAIFDALIAPAMRTPVVTEAEPQQLLVSSIDLDDEDIPIQHVVKTSRFSKQAQEMRNSKQVPFFADRGFFPSPPKSFQLPMYAEAVSRDFVDVDPMPSSRAKSVDPHILEFLDDYAVESDSQTSDSEGSSTSTPST